MSQPPLIEGGQGRSANSLRGDATFFTWALLILIVVLVIVGAK